MKNQIKNQLIEIYNNPHWIKEYGARILLFILFFGLIIYSALEKGTYEEVLFINSFNGKILDKYTERGDIYVLLPNKKNKIRIRSFYNHNYSSNLSDFIKENDSIFKNKNSDTLYIERDLKIYSYEILTYQ